MGEMYKTGCSKTSLCNTFQWQDVTWKWKTSHDSSKTSRDSGVMPHNSGVMNELRLT